MTGKGDTMKIMDRNSIDALFDALKRRGFKLVGPTVRDGAIVYNELGAVADLPRGCALQT